jgi:Mg/Co/Ni transporter MgtE
VQNEQQEAITQSARLQNEQQDTVTKMRGSLAQMGGRLDELARMQNEQRDILEQMRRDADALLQRNKDVTNDRGLIDELSRYRDQRWIDELSSNRDQALIVELSSYRDWAMCLHCARQERRDTFLSSLPSHFLR